MAGRHRMLFVWLSTNMLHEFIFHMENYMISLVQVSIQGQNK